MRPFTLLLATTTLILTAYPPIQAQDHSQTLTLQYQPAPPGNPLVGLVPYAGAGRDRFPHSLEFNYVRFADLVIGPDQYNWAPLEKLLDDVASRGNQTIFRVYLEFSNQTNLIPQFLLDAGLTVHNYPNNDDPRYKPAETPDYENPALRRALTQFIAALGAKYDGDPRIGFITAGLLGSWGEWHNYPRDDLFASKTVQTEVLNAYEAAFHTTPILLRYPAGPDDKTHAENASRPFGFHDDSFAWATLETPGRYTDWYYMALLNKAGPQARNKWKTMPIGGEIRPEAWGHVFDEKSSLPQIQDFAACVEQTHVSWLMDSGLFGRAFTPERKERATPLVRRMGYEFHVPTVTINEPDPQTIHLQLDVENRGVAPFYYDWPIQYALLPAKSDEPVTFPGQGTLKHLLPDAPPRTLTATLQADSLPPAPSAS